MAPATKQMVFRFAPSPNGRLHLGHALSALLNHDAAQKTGGRFLLRMENIDPERSKPEFETALMEDLAWLGISWEQPVRRQSEHMGEYATSLDSLAASGLVYPCICSRSQVAAAIAGDENWPRDPDGAALYPGTCRNADSAARQQHSTGGESAAFRLDMSEALAEVGTMLGWREFGDGNDPRDVRAEPHLWGDAIIARKDVPTSYHLAVVVDDAAQGVTDVIRGTDLFHATSLHRLLQELLGLPAPNYHHHRLLLGEDGGKLSKGTASKSLAALRAEGITLQDIRRLVGL